MQSFCLILVQEKILTVDNLQKRGWLHQEHCVLCDGPLETGLHLALLCPFAKAVWNQVLVWEDFDTQIANTQPEPMHIDDWWDKATQKVPKLLNVLIYTIWNIWKERNRRIFQNSSMDARQVASRAKEDIELHERVFNNIFS